MNMSKKIGIVIAVLMVSALLTALLIWKPWNGKPTWTKEEAVLSVLSQYPGQVTDTVLKDGSYYITLMSATDTYELIMDAKEGSIQSVKRIGATKDPVDPNVLPGNNETEPPATGKPATDKPMESKPPTDKPVLMTAAEASKLALAHVNGIVESVERGHGHDYLVEIEVEDGREAIVQVNAISGVIMSVTWDDEEDSDDESDDV